MLKFTSMTIEDFGPYKGVQTIEFSEENGVIFIWGNNGRGKTTLLNIFRYALYGKFQNRRGKSVDLTGLTNIESRTAGKYGFKVVLRMTDGTSVYELTRQYKLRAGIAKPLKNDDYEEYVFLKKDGAIQPSAERDHLLNLIMPEDISRFFLFDGELLQEYENLIMEDTVDGANIKLAIENILGLPVLTNGESDTATVLEEYQKAKTRTAQSNQQTEQIGAQIAALEVELQEHNAELERVKDALIKEQARRTELEGEMEQNERVKTLLGNLDALTSSVEEKNARRDKLISQIIVVTREAWRGLVGEKVGDVLDGLQIRMKELDDKAKAGQVAKSFIDDMRKAVGEKHCHLCDQDIDGALIAKIEERVKTAESSYGGLTEDEAKELTALQGRRAVLEPMRVPSSKERLEIFEGQLATVKVEISDTERKLKEVMDELERHGEIEDLSKSMQENVKELSQCIKRIEALEESKKAENDQITRVKAALATQNARLDQTATSDDMKLARRKVELCEQIHAIFDEGVGMYRDKRKSDVENDATDLFLMIRNDPDYVALKINDNYGLYIVHSSGEIVPLRSSGYEHVVALSLIGALHKNAPMHGPVIMDSPFGRLDPTHKENITAALRYLSEQVFLLAYTREIDEQQARDSLGPALKKEYRLTRYSAFHTTIDAI